MFNEMHMSQLGKSSSLHCYQLSTHTHTLLSSNIHGLNISVNMQIMEHFFKNKTNGILMFLMFCRKMYYVSTYVN